MFGKTQHVPVFDGEAVTTAFVAGVICTAGDACFAALFYDAVWVILDRTQEKIAYLSPKFTEKSIFSGLEETHTDWCRRCHNWWQLCSSVFKVCVIGFKNTHLFTVYVFPKKGKDCFVPFLLQSKSAILFRESEHRKQKILDGKVIIFYSSFLVWCCQTLIFCTVSKPNLGRFLPYKQYLYLLIMIMTLAAWFKSPCSCIELSNAFTKYVELQKKSISIHCRVFNKLSEKF